MIRAGPALGDRICQWAWNSHQAYEMDLGQTLAVPPAVRLGFEGW